MEFQTVKISSLKKTKLLKRRHSKDQLQRCINSLQNYGQYQPLVVSRSEILCGTLVYDAMRKLKMKTATVIQVGELSEEKKRELRYLDNRTFDMSFWFDDKLKIFLMGLDHSELERCAFNDLEVENLINGFSEEVGKVKKKALQELNEQPDTWYCPKCGWTGTVQEKNEDGEEN